MATVQNLMHNYNEINESTLSGAIDIVAVRQPDGSLKSTPFHVRFGRLQVVKPRDKVVTVRVNEVEVVLKMKLGRSGEAYFVHEADVSDEGELDSDLAVSPIQSPVRSPLPATAAPHPPRMRARFGPPPPFTRRWAWRAGSAVPHCRARAPRRARL